MAAIGEIVLAISAGHAHFPVRASSGKATVDAQYLLDELPKLVEQLEASLRRIRDRNTPPSAGNP
ncbi:hypothetical protein ACMA46_11850 [Clavibacter sp. Sh2141]|uniref:hypothetical protein n=1 Tax=Clavibacter sp. Sh2141 TaxID=3395374 RepID=UPI0039BC9D6D